MKVITVVCICFVLLVSAWAYTVPSSERYANELASNQSLARHADYFRNQYAGTWRGEATWAYLAIRKGELFLTKYELVLEAMTKKEISNPLISGMKIMKDALLFHLADYSSIWSKAIHNHAHNKYPSVDFSTALAITKKEYARIGVFSKIDLIKEKIKADITKYDKLKYPKTYELYAILS